MIAIKRGQELHDRATRMQPLTDGERDDLQRWYDQMDAAEARTLRMPTSGNVETIETQIESTLRDIQATTKQIATVRRENRALRTKIAVLESGITQRRQPRKP
jgi:hypothetical protein